MLSKILIKTYGQIFSVPELKLEPTKFVSIEKDDGVLTKEKIKNNFALSEISIKDKIQFTTSFDSVIEKSSSRSIDNSNSQKQIYQKALNTSNNPTLLINNLFSSPITESSPLLPSLNLNLLKKDTIKKQY